MRITSVDLNTRLRALWPQFIQCALSQPRVKEPGIAPRVTGRTVDVKSGRVIQLTQEHSARVTHSNMSFDDALATCSDLLISVYRRLHLFTSSVDVSVKAAANGVFEWSQSRATKTATLPVHNRRKQYLIPEGEPCPFLMEIGVMSRTGKVLAARYNKFRQINRFLELVDDVVPHLPSNREIRVVDFGSGKSYLTFALHHLLTQIRGRAVNIVGVDRKAEVIQDCSQIAARLGCEGLRFEAGDIADFGSEGAVDLMVALHACDTATDAALAQAVRWKTPVILAVPCCQHELASRFKPDTALETIAAHGILKDRLASLATDALRANLLEICGYQTQVLEFIDIEHTPKNLLIRAIRRDSPDPRINSLVERYQNCVRLLGTEPLYLERALKELLPGDW